MDLCNTVGVMPKEPDVITFRLSEEFRKVASALEVKHGARNRSDYFRGLVYLDATLAGAETDVLDKPAWVTRTYGKLIREAISFFKGESRGLRSELVDVLGKKK